MCIASNSEGSINATATLTVMSKIQTHTEGLLMETIGGILIEQWRRIRVTATEYVEYVEFEQPEQNNLML